MACAASPVATSTVRSARGTVEIGFIATRTRTGSPLVMPPSMPPARLVSRRDRVAGHHLVVRRAAPPARGAEPVADLDALHGLDAHQRTGQPGVEPPVGLHVGAEPDRQPVRDHLDHAAEGVAVVLGRVDLGDHRRGGGLASTRAPGSRRPARRSPGPGRSSSGASTAPSATTCDTMSTPSACLQERLRDRAEHHPRRGLAGAGALQHRPGVVEAELRHARPGRRGPGRGRVSGALRARPCDQLRVDRDRPPSRSPTSATRCCRCAPRPDRPG